MRESHIPIFHFCICLQSIADHLGMGPEASNDSEQKPVISSSAISTEHKVNEPHHFQDARFTSPGFVVAIDFNHDGTHYFHSEAPLTKEESFREALPPVPPEAVRIFLKDSQVFIPPSGLLFHGDYDEDKIDELPPLEGHMRPKAAGQGMARLGGSASYDDGQPLTKSSFAHVKARTFDVFDLENLWLPQENRNVVPFHVQWCVPKKDLDGPQYVRKDKVLEANLGEVFFCDRLYPYWEFISTAETSLDQKGGMQSKLCQRNYRVQSMITYYSFSYPYISATTDRSIQEAYAVRC